MVSEGLLASSGGQYPTLNITPKGWSFLKDRDTLVLARPVNQAADSVVPANRSSDDARLFNELSALRKRLADERGVPAFVIFGDKTLEDMARKAPRTAEEFARVSGVGDAKLREYAEPFLKSIVGYVEQHGLPVAAEVPPLISGKPPPEIIGDSIRESGRLVSSGMSLAEVAKHKGLKGTTVLGHLERLARGSVPMTLHSVMPPQDRVRRIEEAFANLGRELLRPVWEELDEEFSYEELRLVRVGVIAAETAADARPTGKQWASGPNG